jgi:S1-C subfamily serine protease
MSRGPVNKAIGRFGDRETMIADLQQAYTGAVERAGKSTVQVTTAVGPPGPHARWSPRRGHGTGIVLDSSGRILTSEHIVDGADRAYVTAADGRTFSASLVGRDRETDVAVLRVEATDLAPAAFGDSDALKVGQPVLAIGNPLGLAGGPTVTSGVVSSLRRIVPLPNGSGSPMIQTDAAVNPGSSGGPLVDLEGRVVGLNNVTIPYAEGMSFAIPINEALAVATELIEHGRVSRPWLGVVGYDMDRRIAFQYGLSATRGVFIADVNDGSPAQAAGLRVGDVLVSLGGRPVGGIEDLVDAIRERAIGDTIEVELSRPGATARVRATLAARPF